MVLNSGDDLTLEALSRALAQSQRPWLCVIVGAHGSSPRPVGSMVAIDAHGAQTGSISGGCVEEHLIAALLAGEYDDRVPRFTDYGVSAEDNEKLGLPCGGRLQLMVQRLSPDDRDWVDTVISRLSARQVTRRTVDLATGDTHLDPCDQFESLTRREQVLAHSFGPRARLLLVGAGQLAASIASLALAMDFEVILNDSRDWALAQWQGPEVEKILGLPDDVVRERASDRLSAVMTLSHDPRVDDMALMEALESDAWYVGALGSQRTTEKRLQRLAQLGLSAENLAKLHAPIGLPIGSKTPMEIAVSVMAEVTQLRRAMLRKQDERATGTWC